MRGRSYPVEGIILKRSNSGEADRILTIFTKNQGKLRVVAKGIRKFSSKRGGRLELLSWIRGHVVKGKSLDIVAEVESVKNLSGLGSSIEMAGSAYEIIELVDRLTPEGVPNREVFHHLTKYLTEVLALKNESGEHIVSEFAVELLRSLGFWSREKTFAGDWKFFVESIIEKPLKSPRILTRMQKTLRIGLKN